MIGALVLLLAFNIWHSSIVEAGERTPPQGLIFKSSEPPDPDIQARELTLGPVMVSASRLLIPAGDTLYMLGQKKQVLWKWSPQVPLVDTPIVYSDGSIHGVAEDGIQFALDPRSGSAQWRHQLTGKASYSQIKAYRKNMHLVVVDLSCYENPECPSDNRETQDRLELWKGDTFIWHKEFPPGARLHVWGERILAVRTRPGSVEMVEVPQQ